MKKFATLLLATLVMLAGCGEINDRLDALEGRVDAIENTQIATISQQITSINNSILLLNETDKELGEYITALEAEAENLQTQITTTNTQIEEVEQEIWAAISSEKADILAELEALRNTTTTRLEEINATIAELKATDGDMSAQIEALEAEAAQLEAKLAETNTKIDTVKSELTETISTEKAAILAELETFKATVNGELDAIKAVLETLKAKDVELDGKIATLQEYVDTELKETEDWATATFATLEQYNEVVATIATIEGTIEGINESIAALETRLGEKIAKDIETACATLSADLQNAVKEVTEAYTSAIATAKNELTEAYTAALEGAISALETSMKEWVNEQLTAYSTIVSTEAKITALQSEMDGKLAAQKTYLEALVNTLSSSVTTDITAIKKQIKDIEEAIAKNSEEIEALRGELAEQKAELTEAYTAAIAEAIDTAKGEMSEELAAEIAAINDRIDQSDIAAIEALIANCKARMETAESDIVQLKAEVLQLLIDVDELQDITKKLLAQIQSITYIPTYDDGKATIDYHSKRGTLDFQISPKSAVVELEKVWQSALSFKAVHTQTRAVNFINLPITSFETDAANGTITIEVDGTNLGTDFFVEKLTASATIEVSDGNNYIHSAYLNLTANYIIHFEDKEVERLCVLNWDTNGDSKLSYDEAAVIPSLGSTFNGSSSSSYPHIKTFNELKYFTGLIEVSGFKYCKELYQISLPNSVTVINEDSFYYCSSLTSIIIPDGVTIIGKNAFSGCSSLAKVHTSNLAAWCSISFGNSQANPLYYANKLYLNGELVTDLVIPDSVTSIGSFAFYGCSSLTSVTIPDSVTSIGESTFYGCTGELTINSKVIEKGYSSSQSPLYNSSFTSLVVGDNLTKIGGYALYNCTSLTNVTIGEGITSIGSAAFYNCSNLTNIYCKPSTPPALYYSSSYSSFPSNSGMKIYVPTNAYASYKQYTSSVNGTSPSNWYRYKSYIQPYDFE